MTISTEVPYQKLWKELRTRPLIVTWWVLFLVIHVFFVVAYYQAPQVLDYLTREDTWTEAMSVGFYSIAAGLFAFTVLKPVSRWERAWCAVLALGLFFVAGEEWSWGQRFVGYEVAAVENLSTQREFNVHNLYYFADGMVTTERLLTAGSLTLGIFIPIALTLSAGLRRLAIKVLEFPVPHPVIGICFALSYAWYAEFHPGSAHMVAVEESREFTIALGVFAYSLIWFMDNVAPGDHHVVT